jgi:hypothetical protein
MQWRQAQSGKQNQRPETNNHGYQKEASGLNKDGALLVPWMWQQPMFEAQWHASILSRKDDGENWVFETKWINLY